MVQLVAAAEKDIQEEIESVSKLATKASEQAYYKWNNTWTRLVQDVVRFEIMILEVLRLTIVQCYTILLANWLKGSSLITIEEVGKLMKGLSICLSKYRSANYY